MIFLRKLSRSDGREIYAMLQQIDSDDHGFYNKVNGMNYSEYLQWLYREYQFDCGTGLPDWMVPQSSFWLIDGDIPVGYGRMRHYLNDLLNETSGHIGYAVAKPYRGKGYGNLILSLLIEEARKCSIPELQIAANQNNIRSNKVILHNGGVLFREQNGKNFYHITLE